MTSTLCREDQQRALLVELAEVEAQDAQLFARRMALRAEMDSLWNPPQSKGPMEQFGVLELAGTARIGQCRASSQLVDGTRLVEELPRTLAALQAGTMFRETAVLLLQQTRNCSPDVTRELERRLLPIITTANTTDVRRLVAKLIPEIEADLDPDLTRERLEDAQEQRSVWEQDRGDGRVGIGSDLDLISARRWSLDFGELVRAQKVADDKAGIVRTADQRRADVFAQLPSRLLALVQMIQRGEVDTLRSLAQADPDLADELEALAASLPFDCPTDPVDLVDPEEPEELEDPPSERDSGDSPLPSEPLAALPDVVSPLLDEPPPAPEPPEEWTREADPPDRPPHWTDLSLLELASTILGLPVRNPVVLNAHIPVTTLLEVDNRSGTVEGSRGGALPAEHARMLLPTAALRRVFVDPGSGVPIGIDPQLHRADPTAHRADPTAHRADPTVHRAEKAAPRPTDRLRDLLTPFLLRDVAEAQHDPGRRLRRFVEVRDQHYTGIGCSQPAGHSHLDHETAYPAGPTAAWNLSAKSARCHRAKHAGWTVTRHGAGPRHGETTWTSPLGHSYTRLSAWTQVGTRASFRPTAVVEIDVVAHAAAA